MYLILNMFPHLTGHRGLAAGYILEVAHAGIVPIDAVTLFRAEEGDVDMHVLISDDIYLFPFFFEQRESYIIQGTKKENKKKVITNFMHVFSQLLFKV